MGTPKLSNDKSEVNKYYIKRHRNKNAKKYKQEDRNKRKLAEDWLKCLICLQWFHKTCFKK